MGHITPVVGAVGRGGRGDRGIEDEAIDPRAIDDEAEIVDLGGMRRIP